MMAVGAEAAFTTCSQAAPRTSGYIMCRLSRACLSEWAYLCVPKSVKHSTGWGGGGRAAVPRPLLGGGGGRFAASWDEPAVPACVQSPHLPMHSSGMHAASFQCTNYHLTGLQQQTEHAERTKKLPLRPATSPTRPRGFVVLHVLHAGPNQVLTQALQDQLAQPVQLPNPYIQLAIRGFQVRARARGPPAVHQEAGSAPGCR